MNRENPHLKTVHSFFPQTCSFNGFNFRFGGGCGLVCCEELDVAQATLSTYTQGVDHVGNRIRLP